MLDYDDVPPEDQPPKDPFFDDIMPADMPAPAAHRPSLDSIFDVTPMKKTNSILVEKLIHALGETNFTIQRKIEAIENLDISVQIVNYKIYEATHEFKTKISQMKDERNKLLTSTENHSELSLILNDLDQKISDLENELDEKIKHFNQEKIALQQQTEDLILQLDEDIQFMDDQMKDVQAELTVQMGTLYRAQVVLINQKYTPVLDEFEQHLQKYKKLGQAGWKVEHSDTKLTEILEDKGLQFTPSGRLMTRTGSHMTFEEAQYQGYFKEVSVSLDKIFEFFKGREQQQQVIDHIGLPDASSLSEGSSAESKMSSQDVKYLKEYVGKPLTLALAEITAKQPRDPIHYLGHYLFKYRYNQELEEMQKREIDELNEQRAIVAQERWKQFVEEEARNAVIEMVLRAEQIAYKNELKRIEEDQLRAAEEQEEGYNNQELDALMEEARDKFE